MVEAFGELQSLSQVCCGLGTRRPEMCGSLVCKCRREGQSCSQEGWSCYLLFAVKLGHLLGWREGLRLTNGEGLTDERMELCESWGRQ